MPQDDELTVTVPDGFGTADLAAVELPLAVNPTAEGTQAALDLIGGIEELSRVTADEVRCTLSILEHEVHKIVLVSTSRAPSSSSSNGKHGKS